MVGISAGATMYRWVDAQGVVHYSDQPQPGAEKLAVPSAQTYQAPPVPAASANAATSTSEAPVYQSCAITQPPADAALYAPETISVSVQVVPPLRPGDLVSVTLDGAALPGAPGTLSFEVTQPERGAHTLAATVRDSDGNLLCSAAAISFSVQRPSLLSPQSPARGH
jgi:hypothetical protein